jgi:hypothetical protein
MHVPSTFIQSLWFAQLGISNMCLHLSELLILDCWIKFIYVSNSLTNSYRFISISTRVQTLFLGCAAKRRKVGLLFQTIFHQLVWLVIYTRIKIRV